MSESMGGRRGDEFPAPLGRHVFNVSVSRNRLTDTLKTCRHRAPRQTAFALLTFLLAATAGAAPPAVTSLSPAGGERGTTVAVIAAGTFDAWPVQVWSSSPSILVKAEKEKGKFAVTIAKDAPLGAHWLRFHDDTGASPLRPFVVGGLPEIAEVEPNDDPKSAPVLAMPTVVNGVLGKSGDVDCFRVKLAKGQTLIASLEAHHTLRSPMDAILQLVSDTGAVLEQNHDVRGLDPELAFTAPAEGTYAVRLFAFPSQPDSSIRHFGSPACVYRLTLTTGEFVDFSTPLAVERDREATLTLRGWNLKEKTAKLGKSEDRVGIVREAHSCFDSPTDKSLSPPFTVTGLVEKAGSPSVVLVAGTVGKPLAIRLENAELSLNPVLRISGADGKPLSKAEPAELNGEIDVDFNPPATGIYRIEVRDRFDSASPRHAYRLRVASAVPDLDAKLAADRFLVTVGTPLDIPITVKRLHGFTGELVAFAENLPEGIAVEVAPPAAKPDPNTATLRLKATKPFAGGPIRIGVAKKGDDAFRRFASATLADFDRPTRYLWLTAMAPAPKK